MIIDNINEVSEKINDAMKEGMRQAAEVVTQRMSDLAKASFQYKWGGTGTQTFMKSISTQENQGQTFTDKRGHTVTVPIHEPYAHGSDSVGIDYSIEAPYAASLEDGSRPHNIPKTQWASPNPPHPGIKSPYHLGQVATDQCLADGSVAAAMGNGAANSLGGN